MRKTYKKIVLLSAAMAIFSSATALAAATSSDATYEISSFIQVNDDDLAQLKAETSNILSFANDYYISGDISRKVKSSDIDWNKLEKMYVPTDDLLNSDSIDVTSFLQDAEYIWTLPINVDSKTIQIVFNKGKEVSDDARDLLTDEQIQRLESYVGKWRASGSMFYEKKIDYEKDIQNVLTSNNLTDEYQHFMLTALPGINTPIAVVTNGNTLEYAFPALKTVNEQFAKDISITKSRSSFNGLYDYSDLIEFSNNYLNNN